MAVASSARWFMPLMLSLSCWRVVHEAMRGVRQRAVVERRLPDPRSAQCPRRICPHVSSLTPLSYLSPPCSCPLHCLPQSLTSGTASGAVSLTVSSVNLELGRQSKNSWSPCVCVVCVCVCVCSGGKGE